MSYQNVVEIKDVTKGYGDGKPVIRHISFEIQKGEFFGLLGPNGAGKSTLMRTMYCSSPLEKGEMYILGLNVKKNQKEIKSRIGIVPQEDGLDTELSVFENLYVFARFHGLNKEEANKRTHDLLKEISLEEYSDSSIDSLSGGMKRRLVIARSQMNKPELLFLDEPTTGLDPQTRLWTWNYLKRAKKEGLSMVLTTHYMEEAENLCDRIAIVDGGQVFAIGTPKNLIAEHIGREVVEFETEQNDISYYMGRLESAGYRFQVFENTISVMIRDQQTAQNVLSFIHSDKITVRRATLNDVFLKLSGHHLRDE